MPEEKEKQIPQKEEDLAKQFKQISDNDEYIVNLQPSAFESDDIKKMLDQVAIIEGIPENGAELLCRLCDYVFTDEEQQTKNDELKQNIEKLFSNLLNNTYVMASPKDNAERKELYTKLKNAYTIIATILFEKLRRDEKDTVIGVLKTIGEGGGACCSRWIGEASSLIRQLKTEIIDQYPHMRISEAKPPIISALENLFLEARVKIADRLARQFANDISGHTGGNIHYENFFKYYLNFSYEFKLPIIWAEDPILGDISKVQNEVDIFIEDLEYSLNDYIIQEARKLFFEQFSKGENVGHISDWAKNYFKKNELDKVTTEDTFLDSIIFDFSDGTFKINEGVVDILLVDQKFMEKIALTEEVKLQRLTEKISVAIKYSKQDKLLDLINNKLESIPEDILSECLFFGVEQDNINIINTILTSTRMTKECFDRVNRAGKNVLALAINYDHRDTVDAMFRTGYVSDETKLKYNIMLAIRNNDPIEFEKLFKFVDDNMTKEFFDKIIDGRDTLLMFAINNRYIDVSIINTILNSKHMSKEYFDKVDVQRNTALMLAVQNNNESAVRAILKSPHISKKYLEVENTLYRKTAMSFAMHNSDIEDLLESKILELDRQQPEVLPPYSPSSGFETPPQHPASCVLTPPRNIRRDRRDKRARPPLTM